MIFIRHPMPYIMPGLCYRRLDIGLGPGATEQIDKALKTVPCGLPVVSSPARRCVALAQPLAARDNREVREDERLWELNFGTWEGQLWDEIPRSESDPWADNLWTIAPPGGEAFAALYDRVQSAIADAPDQAIVVTHAGVIRAAKMILLGESLDQVFAAEVPYATPILIQSKAA